MPPIFKRPPPGCKFNGKYIYTEYFVYSLSLIGTHAHELSPRRLRASGVSSYWYASPAPTHRQVQISVQFQNQVPIPIPIPNLIRFCLQSHASGCDYFMLNRISNIIHIV